jgi:hypothetical protein
MTRAAVRSPGGWLSGGLDRATLVVAGVATLGLIMAVLDTQPLRGELSC